MSIHTVLESNLMANISMPHQTSTNDHDTVEPIPTDLPQRRNHLQVNSPGNSSSIRPPTSGNNVDTIASPYTALTNQAVKQHQHHYDATANDVQPLQRFEASFAYPYQRYSGHNPSSAQANGPMQVPAVPVDTPSYAKTTSTISTPIYTGTISNMSTISYNSTSLDAYQSASSVRARPEYERYTHTQHNDQDNGYWQTQPIGYDASDSKQDLMEMGSQFEHAN